MVSYGMGSLGSVDVTQSADILFHALRGAPKSALIVADDAIGVALQGRRPVVLPCPEGKLPELPEVGGRVFVEDAVTVASRLELRPALRRALWDVSIADVLATGVRVDRRPLEVLARDYARLPPAPRTSPFRPGDQLRIVGQRASVLLAVGLGIEESQVWTADLGNLIGIESQAAIVVSEMAAAGVLVDEPGVLALVQARARERDQHLRRLQELGIRSPTSERELLQELSTLTGQRTASSREALEPLGEHPVRDALHGYRRAHAFVNDFGTKLLHAARSSSDGRVRASWNSLGSVTGRLSCSEPNLLAIPRAPSVRSRFRADLGHRLISIDASQMELRVAADVLDEKELLELFKDADTDIHTSTAALLSGKRIDDVSALERSRAKAVNFGLLLGMREAGLKEYAWEEFGLHLSIEEAAELRAKYRTKFRAIAAWQDEIARNPIGLETTRCGRRQWCNDGRASARLAHRIQGTAADALKHALVMVAPLLPGYGARLVLAPHDELVFEVPEDDVDAAVRSFKLAIEEGFRQVLPRVELKFDVTVGVHWS